MTLPPDKPAERKASVHRTGALGRLVLVIGALCIALPDPAGAQEKRTLFDMLFGPRRAAPPSPNDPRFKKVPQPDRPRPPKRVAKPVEAETAPPVEKAADARKLLVVGDFIASGAGDGLTDAFATTPGILVVEKPNGSSGLVRDDYYNWLTELPRLLDEERPSAIIIALGTNDRQQMVINGQREKFGTDLWYEEYGRRITALAAIAKARKVPQIWVGLPPFQAPSMSAYAVTLNGILEPAIEKAGGTFIDVWDGFADETGKFVSTASDINGQPARLRSNDGIGLTKAGRRKLAFYLEKPVRDLFGQSVETAKVPAFRLDNESLPDLLSLSAPGSQVLETTVPIGITDPDLDGGAELLGSGRSSFPQSPSAPRRTLLERGELPPAPTDRADNVRSPSTP